MKARNKLYEPIKNGEIAMPIRVKATFAEGVTREDIERTVQAAGDAPSDGPPGSIGETQEMIENGRIVFITDFESQDAFDQFEAMARTTFEQVGVPFPKFEVENI